MRIARPFLVPLVTVALLASCAGRVTRHPGSLPERDLPSPVLDGWPADLRALAGFDELISSDDAGWIRAGHSLLYRLHLHTGSEDREWIVAMRLLGARGRQGSVSYTLEGEEPRVYGVEFLPVGVELLEVGTDERTLSTLWLARSSMEYSLFRTSRWFDELQAEGVGFADLDAEAQEALALGSLSTVSLLGAWQEDETLAGVLKTVVGLPVRALMGAVMGGGMSYTVQAAAAGDSDVTIELPPSTVALEGRRVPLNILLGGTTLMHVELEVVRPDAPLNVGAGIVRMRGAHPTDADRWVEVELIGARTAK